MAKQVIYRRGTTAEHANFVGANGEITVDTVKHVVVVHDGVTAGGVPLANATAVNTSISSLTANAANQASAIILVQSNIVSQASTIANLSVLVDRQAANIDSSNLSIITNSFTDIRANLLAAHANIQLLAGYNTVREEGITLANANIALLQNDVNSLISYQSDSRLTSLELSRTYILANVGALDVNAAVQNIAINNLQSNAASQAVAINSINANVAAANSAIEILQSGLSSSLVPFAASLNELLANAVVQANLISNLQSNVSTLTNNAATQATSINSLFSNAATQATSINSISSNVSLLQSNAATQQNLINFISNVTDGQTATLLLKANLSGATFTGNVTAGNVTATGFYFANGTPFVSGSGSGTYTNSNVADYLPTHTGNVKASAITNLASINLTGDRTKFDPFVIRANPVTVMGNIEFNDTYPTTTSNNSIGISSQLRVSGRLQVIGDITMPNENNFNEVYNIGQSATVRYNNIWVKTVNTATLNVTGSMGGSGVPLTAGQITAGDMLPSANLTYNIGSTVAHWATIYSQRIATTGNISTGANVIADSFVSTRAGIPTLSSSTNLNLTANNAVVVTQSPLRMASFTNATRALLTGQNGDIIYNTDENKFQGYANGSWVDLH